MRAKSAEVFTPEKKLYVSGWTAKARSMKHRSHYHCELDTNAMPDDPTRELTVHHLNHNKEDNDDDNLLVSCSRCHERLQRVAHPEGKKKMLEAIAEANGCSVKQLFPYAIYDGNDNSR